MAIRIKRDADNTWYTYIDWNPWIDNQAEASPNGPGLTVTITAMSWAIPAVLTEESQTSSDDDDGYTYFFGSGGVNGTAYDIEGTCTYTVVSASGNTTKTGLTQTRTITVELEDQ